MKQLKQSCSCGCGKTVKSIEGRGRQKEWADGHGQMGHLKQRIRELLEENESLRRKIEFGD